MASSGDRVLREDFRYASAERLPLYLLRLVGPEAFRKEVIEVARNGILTEAFQALLDERIPALEFILADPRCDSFLNRLDAELKDTRNIWRVRRDVIAFARGLLTARRLRSHAGHGPLEVNFHRKPLIWNLSVVGSQRVVARAYFTAASGHDGVVEDMNLASDGATRLAESLIAYYKSIRDDESTTPIADDAGLDRLKRWPSLFKANATWTDQVPNGQPVVTKVVGDAEVRNFEAAWLDSRDNEASACHYFRPVELVSVDLRGRETYGGEGVQMKAVVGITAEQLMYEIQRFAASNPRYVLHLSVLAHAVFEQSFAALREFRATWERLGNGRRLVARIRTYPWRDQLRMAMSEAGRFATRDPGLLSRVAPELEEIGEHLEAEARVPFRDAHLKNRLVEFSAGDFDGGGAGFANWLESHPPETIAAWLRAHSHDIDFETTRFLVGEAEDPLHILISPNLGWKPASLLANGCARIRNWWPHKGDTHSMMVALLGRSLRELCRRIWYANVMPNTFQQRYRTERREHFLELATAAAARLPQWPYVREMLQVCCDQRQRIWPVRVRDFWDEPVVVGDRPGTPPHSDIPDVGPPPRPDRTAAKGLVFISSSHKDYAHAHTVNDYLCQRGVNTFFCEITLAKRGDTNFQRQIDEALDQCRHMVVVTSSSANVVSEWVRAEWGFFINEQRSGRKVGNVITVAAGEIAMMELPPSLRYCEVVPLNEVGLAKLLQYVTPENRR